MKLVSLELSPTEAKEEARIGVGIDKASAFDQAADKLYGKK